MSASKEQSDTWTESDRVAEIARVEQVMTVEEIFAAGFHAGHANAGIVSKPELPFIEWLEARLERRVR